MAVVITDGKQTTTGSYTRLSVASQGIKNKGVTVYAVGIGSSPDRAELEEIASRPENVLTSASFTALQTIAPELRKAVCDGKSGFTLCSRVDCEQSDCQQSLVFFSLSVARERARFERRSRDLRATSGKAEKKRETARSLALGIMSLVFIILM